MDGMTLRPSLTIGEVRISGGVHLVLRGDLDCASAPELRLRIRKAMAAGATIVELDIAGVSFIDAAGVGVLIGALRQLMERGGQLHLQRIPRPVQRVFDIVGMTPPHQAPGGEGRGAFRKDDGDRRAGIQRAPEPRRRRSSGSGRTAAIWVAAVAVLGTALAACGYPAGTAGEGEPTGGEKPNAVTPAPGAGLTVAEALDSQVAGPLAVRGYVLARAGRTHLCEVLAQSYPPQCGGRSIALDGYDAANIPGTEEEQGVRWSTNHVELMVERRGHRFVVIKQ